MREKQQDLERMVAVLRDLAPSIKKSSDETRSPALRVIDCVLSLNRRYHRFVVKRLELFEQENPAVRTVTDLKFLINSVETPHSFMVTKLDYKHEARANTLSAVVNWLADVSGAGREQEQLRRLEDWARDAHPEDYAPLDIKGFKLAGFQYLRMLFGANTTKPDVHIRGFVASHVGHQVSDVEALRLLEKAVAALEGVVLCDVDATVWQCRARGSQG